MRRLTVVAVLFICAFAAPSWGATKTRKKHSQPLEKTVAGPGWFRYPQFSDAEVRLVVNWFQDAVESGRKLVAAIPASIHTEIHRGAKLTERAFQALAQPPQDLLAKLPPMPQGYQRMLAGSTMVIVKTDEQLVVDTMPVRR